MAEKDHEEVRLRSVALQNAKNGSEEVTVLQEEERNVSGQKVLFLKTDIKSKGIPFRFIYYIWSGSQGAVQFIVYTPRNLADEYGQDLSDLLNGMLIVSRP